LLSATDCSPPAWPSSATSIPNRPSPLAPVPTLSNSPPESPLLCTAGFPPLPPAAPATQDAPAHCATTSSARWIGLPPGPLAHPHRNPTPRSRAVPRKSLSPTRPRSPPAIPPCHPPATITRAPRRCATSPVAPKKSSAPRTHRRSQDRKSRLPPPQRPAPIAPPPATAPPQISLPG